jgi:serine protease Do
MNALGRHFKRSISEEVMTQPTPRPTLRNAFTIRRLVLLASAATLAGTVGAAGLQYGSHAPGSFGSAAHAAELSRPAGFADLVAKVKPAVISVRVKTKQSASPAIEKALPRGMERFFRDFGFDPFEHRMPGHRRHYITGVGSGFFISADGYAVTNYHVVDHATSVQVATDDGKEYTARVIGTDQKTDLALIKVDAGKDFTFVRFGDHPPRVGDWVVAVGNPFGLGGTVTAGIVSARGRDIGAGPYNDYIQIDAPINKGNSGGPTFNSNGEVVGVNTAIYSPSGGSVGIGFDIPAETAKLVIAQLKEKGVVTRGWMGVQVQPVTRDIADSLGLKEAHGAIVSEPQADGPAATAGIMSGDVITAVNGDAVRDSRDLARRISATSPGTTVKLDIVRNGVQKTLDVTLAKLPAEHRQAKTEPGAQANETAYLGVAVAPAPEMGSRDDKGGVIVTGLDPSGPAAEHGIKTGDVILSVGGKGVDSASDVRSALEAARQDGKDHVLVRLKSAEATRFIAIPIG